MTQLTKTCSPVHHLLEAQQPTWGSLGDMPVVINFQSVEVEQAAIKTLGLCDLSGLLKLGIKGNAADRWLAEQGIETADMIYEARRLPDEGVVIRVADNEFLLESGLTNETVPKLAARLATSTGHICALPRQDATFLMVGSEALNVLAQTCGINFREVPNHRLILTRVAGVSCGVLPEQISQLPVYRLWVDPSYAVYLWETLLQIGSEFGGVTVGAGCLFPELK